ncbi:MAG: ATP-grasp domain-containing protein [Acidobacteriaceae bacterium]
MTEHVTATAPPRILLATVRSWPLAARLAMALHDAGASVTAWCPSGHPMLKTRAIARRHTANALTPVASLAHAIECTVPDLIVPADDQTTAHLHALYRRSPGTLIAALIERSLGDPGGFPMTSSRARLLALAQSRSVPVPATRVIASPGELRSWFADHGFPAFLKADGTSGGTGVKRVRSFGDAEAAFHALSAPPSLLRASKRTLLDGDRSLLLPALHRERPVITVQRHVQGTDANSAVFCWRGKVLAGIAAQVLHTRNTHGPSTVVRLIEDRRIDHAAQQIAAALNLSGFYGFDFVIEERSGQPLLIEMNARATQIAHLPRGQRGDLAAAAFSTLSGQPIAPRPSVIGGDIVALFPQEWYRDPASSYLRTGYHDVPWSEPDLVAYCIRNKPGWQRWLTYEHWRSLRAKPATSREAASSLHPETGISASTP